MMIHSRPHPSDFAEKIDTEREKKRRKETWDGKVLPGYVAEKYGNFWPVVRSWGVLPRFVPRSVGHDGMRPNGRLALAQSRSHRSCQRNRGNFCLINDIDFDIFPRPRRPPLAPRFLLRVDVLYGHRSGKPCRRKLTIVARG